MRPLAIPVLLLTLGLGACSSDSGSHDGAASGSAGAEMGLAGATSSVDTTTGEGDESAGTLELTLEGVPEVLSGSARLEVRELNPLVNVVVTALFPSSDDDLVRLSLGVMGVDRAMGTHRQQFTSERDSPALAIAYVERVSYISQSGSLEVTLTGDGRIEGRFDAELAPDLAGSSTDSALTGQPFSMSGRFAGTWMLVCSSPVIGLPGDHSVSDSAYCNSLQF